MSNHASTSTSIANDALPEDLIPLANSLLHATLHSPLSTIQELLKAGAPAWYQTPELGWSCLHYASERRDPEILTALLRGGAVWNAIDKWGRGAGEVCLSFGWREGWEIIRNEGVRSEMLIHAMGGAGGEGTVTLRSEEGGAAGDNLEFLKSELRWEVGEDGKERVMDADGNGVMMGWEEPLMEEHVRLMTENHPDAALGGKGMVILNVGYGLGIIDRIFQAQSTPPLKHVIIEAHPQVLSHLKTQPIYTMPGVTILEGRWQNWLLDPAKLGEVLELTGGDGFGGIFVDTFAEGYEDLKAFFEVLPDILEPEHGVFSFWNGLGATNPTIYSVSSNLAELHLEDVGLKVQWTDVAIPESLREEVWKGVRRRYWDLPGYRLPIARMDLGMH